MAPVPNEKPNLRNTFRRGIVEIAIFSLVLNACLLVPPLYMMQVYDRVLPASSMETLAYLSVIAVAALAFMGLIDVVRSIYSQRVAASLDRNLGAAAFSASLNSVRADSGDTQPLRDLQTVRTFIASRGLANLFDLPFAPLFVALLYFVHPVLFWVTTIGAAVMIVLVILNQLSIRNASAASQEQVVAASLSAQSFVRAADTLRAMGMTRNATETWGSRFSQSVLLQDRAANINSIFAGISRTLRMMLQLAILGIGALLVIDGDMTAGMIFASSIISGRALQPIDQLVGNWKFTVEARRAWARVSQAIAKSAQTSKHRLQLPEPKGRLAAQDLVWAAPNQPPGSAPIIKRLTFEIAAGEAVAVIGPSGAGKSTLARLLAGALMPSSGAVIIDGADYKTWDPDQIGRSIGYLAQDVQLLPGTIADNIARFDPDKSDQQVVAAAQNAQAHDLIMGLPDGYQTMIMAIGTNLSGGTRQRIGLARAFYGSPKILILDEPGANLDAEGEFGLDRALQLAKESQTTVVLVTHRPATASRCDKVIMLRNGTMEAFGPAADTLRKLNPKAGAQIKSPALAGPGRGAA